jgi:alpha-ketoglutarate-dependent taurine dioxygenase
MDVAFMGAVAPFEVSPLMPGFGASIGGADLSSPLHLDALKAVFRDHRLVAIRGQALSNEKLYAFASIFGAIEGHTVRQHDGSKWDAVHTVTNLDLDGNPVEKPFINSNYFWHTDKSFLQKPALATMLHAVELPPKGGDTQFADMTAAFRALSDGTKKRIEGMRVIHSLEYMRRFTGSAPPTEDDLASAPPIAHPLVRTHQDTGEKSLYLGMYCSYIDGLPIDEGRKLVEELQAHATSDRFVYNHVWKSGDLMVWDNRCTLHRAIANYEMGKFRRVLMRVVVKGDAPF